MELAKDYTYTEEDYYNTPEDVRVELINGQIYNQAAPTRIHQEIISFLNIEIGNYIRSKDGPCKVYPAPFAVKLYEDGKTIVEPDITVVCDRNKLTDKGCTGAPDWIIEIISPSTASHDYIRKLNLYAAVGVREYWIVDHDRNRIVVYHLEESNFEMATFTFLDKVKVNVYDDLFIDFQGISL